ncbi:hypothetical protein AB2S62_02600 [Vibrio sp. NTOU-M3]|uniref:hypothetical protein n=1 Tax=Vibrio sp. NTOU-M3 TaxID=3234954 RepID=UPI00349F3FEB
MKIILGFVAALLTNSVLATELPTLPAHKLKSPHQLFLSSEQDHHGFDSWSIDGGYSYNVFNKIDLYVGARVNNTESMNNGLISGVSYQVSPKISVKSTLHTYADTSLEEQKETAISAELSSRMQLTDNLDLHATLDYQTWQQGVEVGLGFRF